MRLYLDSNIFIYAMEAETDTGQLARAVLRQIETHALEGVTSEISLAEVLRGGNAAANTRLQDAYLKLLSDRAQLRVRPVSRDMLIGAARVRVRRKLELIDAVHLATALSAGCDAFLTEDIRLSVPAELRKLTLIQQAGAR